MVVREEDIPCPFPFRFTFSGQRQQNCFAFVLVFFAVSYNYTIQKLYLKLHYFVAIFSVAILQGRGRFRGLIYTAEKYPGRNLLHGKSIGLSSDDSFTEVTVLSKS